MRRRTLIILILQILLITHNPVESKIKKLNYTKSFDHNAKHEKNNFKMDRFKRSIDDEEDKPFWANRGKKYSEENRIAYEMSPDVNFKSRDLKFNDDVIKDPPFWGNRGRRFDSSSIESNAKYLDDLNMKFEPFDYVTGKTCQYACYNPFYKLTANDYVNYDNTKSRREEISPFWGTRGRRNSNELDDNTNITPFWGNRGRRQDEDSPFWGNRGRRQEETPFWGNRGRRQDDSPFWGARGRREDSSSSFWNYRGSRQEETPFWGNRGRRNVENFKQSVINEDEHKLRRGSIEPFFSFGTKTSFWGHRGRDSKLKDLFDGNVRTHFQNRDKSKHFNSKNSRTMYDDKMYVEEPSFILFDRSSRSSSVEDDPFYIVRGKKKIRINGNAGRGRRGIIEDIVKSVKSDPYFIARGKKDQIEDSANATTNQEKMLKTKELICSAIELLSIKGDGGKLKRETEDNDRDRRTILKKLAAQLQADPYFVSRGKKNDNPILEEDITSFITRITEMCI